ncbi:MAG: DNA polymerase III subunit gamma/tau [Vicinamibacterales bacterium]
MSYQVLARRWRPRRFDEVVGQRGVTETLQNAIRTGRLAQAFVFAGPRGVGKTTTARILSRALNCEKGPIPEPCGACEPCVEIFEGRDMDVLEIDAATHTQVENVREVIVEGLAIPPIRDRYKIFIIDEFHQLSKHSFNALLKSLEEPPPRVAFIMATTELRNVPDTVLSRSQVFEFRPISWRAITEQLKKIAQAEGLKATDEALALVARAADGSMRDAQTALDQVIGFSGETITVESVQSVLGLVGRDLLFEVIEAVADEKASAAFDLPARAAEAGYDFRLIVRELSRLVRDLMVVSVDRSRLDDREVTSEAERGRLAALADKFSREDLLRAFDVLTRAEMEIRGGAEPRYHLEMALLRWMHLRKLAPIERVIGELRAILAPGPGGSRTPGGGAAGAAGTAGGGEAGRRGPARLGTPPGDGTSRPSTPAGSVPGRFDQIRESLGRPGGDAAVARPPEAVALAGPEQIAEGGKPKAVLTRDAFLAEVRAKAVFHRMVIAQAQRIDVAPEGIVFTFSPGQRHLKEQVEENRKWLESVASRLAGHRVVVTAVISPGNGADNDGPEAGPPPASEIDVKAAALADPTAKALAEVFPVEFTEIEDAQDPR